MRPVARRWIQILLLVGLPLAAWPAVAQASFPGANGKILLERADEVSPYLRDIWSVNPDGTGATDITNTPTIDESAGSWSPDGTKIAFVVYPGVWVMNADGTNRTDVTPDVSGAPFYSAHVKASDVAWSPDGTQIAISNGDGCAPNHSPGQVILIDPNGSNPTRVVCHWPSIPAGTFQGSTADGVSWHPDGSKLVLSGPISQGCAADAWTVNRDGTGMTDITSGDAGDEVDPDWAPDGSRIVFEESGNCGDLTPLSTMSPGGSGKTTLSTLPEPPPYISDDSPVWSPDGAQVMFSREYGGPELWRVDSDGSDQISLTELTGITGRPTSWLATTPQNSYARPKGATPVRVSLVPAYQACTAPDMTHGPPLESQSCSGPQQASPHLTVGSTDANGQPALSSGFLKMTTMTGAPGGVDDTDVDLRFAMDDVFTDTLDDYGGELRVSVPLRITDKDNTPDPSGRGAATVEDETLELVAPCAPVPDPTRGSLCNSETTVDALVPGAATEGKRMVWQLGRVAVYDGGADGDANTPVGDALFATQGIFVP